MKCLPQNHPHTHHILPTATHTTNASLNLEQDVCVCVCLASARLHQRSGCRLSLPRRATICWNPSGLQRCPCAVCRLSAGWMLDHGGHAPRQPAYLPARGSSRGLMLYAAPSGLCYFGTGLYLPGGSWRWKSSGQQQVQKRLVVGLKNRPPAARHSGPHPVRADGRLGLPPIRQPAASTTHRTVRFRECTRLFSPAMACMR